MQISIATWNINSVRLRIDQVARFVKVFRPDVLCLQETKCQDQKFPLKRFARLGYVHSALNGQKGYHGVAVLSLLPFEHSSMQAFCGKSDCRHIAVTLGERAFLDEMRACAELGAAPHARTILVGDLNVAPLEHDVWSHRRLLDVVSHTPIECAKLDAVQAAGSWIDVMRSFVPEPAKLYTWWSYRSPDWAAADKGRRLDHIWVKPELGDRVRAMTVAKQSRAWSRPSDHVPVVAALEL
jgi:exodeoxyribonuclease-3